MRKQLVASVAMTALLAACIGEPGGQGVNSPKKTNPDTTTPTPTTPTPTTPTPTTPKPTTPKPTTPKPTTPTPTTPKPTTPTPTTPTPTTPTPTTPKPTKPKPTKPKPGTPKPSSEFPGNNVGITPPDQSQVSAINNSAAFWRQTDYTSIRFSADYYSFTILSAYHAIKLAYAHASSFTGKEITISILGPLGFHNEFTEFKNKKVTKATADKKGALSNIDSVVAIAAGSGEAGSLKGVAYDANLHIGSFVQDAVAVDETPLMSGLSETIIKATAANAKVSLLALDQLALGDTTYADYLKTSNSNPAKTIAENWALSNSAIKADKVLQTKFIPKFDELVAALKDFTKNGVLVLPAYETQKGQGIHFLAGLPMQVDELKEKSLAVASAMLAIEPYSAAILDIKLLGADAVVGAKTSKGAGCFQAAAYCLSAPAHIYSLAKKTDKQKYEQSVDVLYGAAVATGSVALLRQAFPTLKPEEIVDRMLASANNNFPSFKKTGTTTFTNGFQHDYNDEFGHGLMDLEAALKPIGKVGLPATTRAAGGVTPLSAFTLTRSEVVSPALNKALENTSFTMFDSLGAPFVTSGKLLTQQRASALNAELGKFKSTTAQNSSLQANFASFAFNQQNAPISHGNWQFGFDSAQAMAENLGFANTSATRLARSSSIMGLTANGFAAGALHKEGAATFGMFSYMDAATDNKQKIGFGATAAYKMDMGATYTLGLTSMRENGSFLGLGSAINTPEQIGELAAYNTSLSAGVKLPIAGLTFAANAELGISNGQEAGLISDISTGYYSGFALSVASNNNLLDGDQLSLSFSQPLYMEQGSLNLRLPQGRNLQGEVNFAEKHVDLADSARQFQVGFEYASPVTPATNFHLGGALMLNESGKQGKTGAKLLTSITHRF
ncbi:S8 family serine peptidase [Polycladidibacter stylochi]|uniref:S8 family serine peptidase n=1 Tax=Polycladidibacter stylochi TaxID=1807766 RepID=UPI000836C47C|nr:S8 family serine peptidase [Pseudovibrio stylochi]